MVDPKWLDALKLPLKVTVGVAVAAGLLLALDLQGWLDLGALGTVVRPVLVVVLVLSGVLSIMNAIDLALAPRRARQHVSLLAARRAIRKQEEGEEAQARQRVILARLDHLSEEEIHYVAECLTKNTSSFYTWSYSSGASQLVAKGLAWSPGGTHHQDNYPFTFQDFVWSAIQERREEFLEKEAEYERARRATRGRR